MIKLEKTPVFLLSQLGWTKDNVDKHGHGARRLRRSWSRSASISRRRSSTRCFGSVVGSVVDSKVAMEHEADGDMGNGWLKTNSAGSGAYIIKSWTPNDSVVLEANPNYRGGAAKLKRVVIRHIPEASAQRLALEKGDVDIADNLTPDQIAAIWPATPTSSSRRSRRRCSTTSAST